MAADKDTVEAFKQALKESGIGKGNSAPSSTAGNAAGAGFGAATKDVIDSFNPLSAASKAVGAGMDAAGKAYNNLKGVIEPSLGTWRELSASGANFNNDIVGMTAAAAGARLDIAEFGQVIKNNSGNFNGLGGSAAKGAENFAKLSKEMADSGVTDDLRMMGMTSRDINDVLAITLTQQQTVNMNDEASKKRAIKAATELATEMDLMSKLTGKSRAEQEESLKKAQADMQVEAKLRILTMGKSEEEAAAIRNNYLTQYNEANLRGQGQMFKEVFATGTVQSEEAANQVAISGREAQATMAQARATAEGNAKAATEYSKQASAEMMKNQNDVNKLSLAVYSSNTAAGETMKASMTANAGIYKSETALMKQMEKEGKLDGIKDEAEKRRIVHEEALKQAKAEQTDKKPGSESTEALVKLGARADDVNSAFMNKVVVPINKDVGPALQKFNDGLLNSQVKDKSGNVTTVSKTLEKEVGEGYQRGKEGFSGPNAGKDGVIGAAKDSKSGSPLENAAATVGESAGFATGKILLPALDKTADVMNNVKKMAEGGTVNKPELAIIGEAGKEHIVPDEKMQTLMQNMKVDGLTAAATAMADSQKGGGVNVSEISNLVKTTISSASGPTTGAAAAAPMTKSEKFQTADWADATQEEIAKGLEGSKKQLARWTTDAQETEQKIADIKSLGSKRQLTESEQYDLDELEKEKAKNQRAIDYHQTTINVLNNLDEYKARLETESKQKVVSASEEAAKIAESLGLTQIDTVKQSAEEQKTILSEHQQTTLKYAYTDAEGKKMQLENAKNLVDAEKNAIAEKNKQIEEIQVAADGRELTNREKSRIEKLQKEIEGSKETLSYREQDLAVYANLDKLKTEQITKQAEAQKRLEELGLTGTTKQIATQAEAQKRYEEISKGGIKTEEEQRAEATKMVEASNAKIEKLKADATGKTEAAAGKTEEPSKSVIPDFSSFGEGVKGSGLPPFLQKLNAQIKDSKPAPIKSPTEANKDASKTTAQAVKEEKKEEPKKQEAKKEEKPATGTVAEVTMKDLHASLEHLNKSMTSLLSYSQQTATAAQQQVKATKSLSGNKFA